MKMEFESSLVAKDEVRRLVYAARKGEVEYDRGRDNS